jgi:hypothetical protein
LKRIPLILLSSPGILLLCNVTVKHFENLKEKNIIPKSTIFIFMPKDIEIYKLESKESNEKTT